MALPGPGCGSALWVCGTYGRPECVKPFRAEPSCLRGRGTWGANRSAREGRKALRTQRLSAHTYALGHLGALRVDGRGVTSATSQKRVHRAGGAFVHPAR